jgi:hypothetical protein
MQESVATPFGAPTRLVHFACGTSLEACADMSRDFLFSTFQIAMIFSWKSGLPLGVF